MAIITAWLQDDAYPARMDRYHIKARARDQERCESTTPGNLYGLWVQQAGTPNTTVDITVGRAFIQGDNEPDQGFYLFESTALENLPMPAAPGSDSRIDLVIAQINDAQAGGAVGPSGVLMYVEGVAGPSPVAPALPDSAMALASILRTSAESSITDGAITRLAPDSPPGGIGSGPSLPPAGYGVLGDVWIVTA